MVAAAGRRIEWSDVPSTVRDATNAVLGAPIVEAVNTVGGFSPGPAARCTLADGRRVFVKAVGDELNTLTTLMHRREAAISASLPEHYPSPRLLHFLDLGDWVVLVFELLDGANPTMPWTPADLHASLQLLERMAELGTPSPLAGIEREGQLEVELAERFAWRKLVDEPHLAEQLDEWPRRNLRRLADLDEEWVAAAQGETLLHRDFRADNIVITADGARLVDWPSALIGAEWLDLVGFLPSAVLHGAGDAETIFRSTTIGRRADPECVNIYVCSLAGYFTRNSLMPPPPNIHGLREFQAAQGKVTMEWLAQRLGW